MSENLSCPFCGGTETRLHPWSIRKGMGYRIECVWCGVLGDGWYSDEESAWMAWNRPRDNRNAARFVPNEGGD